MEAFGLPFRLYIHVCLKNTTSHANYMRMNVPSFGMIKFHTNISKQIAPVVQIILHMPWLPALHEVITFISLGHQIYPYKGEVITWCYIAREQPGLWTLHWMYLHQVFLKLKIENQQFFGRGLSFHFHKTKLSIAFVPS